MKIAIVAFDDFTDLDLILHWDLLNRVNSIGGKKDWSVKILGTKSSHLSTLGLPIPTSGMIDEVSGADGVIICSGKGTRPLLKDADYLKRLKLDPDRQIIGAQCSGSLILGALGFLQNKRVTAYPPITKELEQFNVQLVNESLVIENNIATASSCLAGQYLSRWMIKSLVGEEMAVKVMRTVEPL
ncbi:MAG: DJ-1/PfpI family protein [Bdellovibrionota bacterium]